MTVPLRVFQRGGIRFVPELPAAKRKAIERLGASEIAKKLGIGRTSVYRVLDR